MNTVKTNIHNEYDIASTDSGLAKKVNQPPNFQQLPSELKHTPNWVLHKNKEPYQPNGMRAKVNDPKTWSSYANAVTTFKKGGFDGIGFVFTKGCGITGIDLDACISDTGEIVPVALEIVQEAKSYTERSQSGKGLHILTKSELPEGGKRRGMQEHGFKGIEFYDTGRFFVMTGNHLEGTPQTLEMRQEAVNTLHSKYCGSESTVEPVEWHSGINESVPHTLSELDERIIRRAKEKDEVFADLWEGLIDRYDFDESRADLALCSKLMRIKNDPVWVELVFYCSGLYRDKWERKDYRESTIKRACNGSDNHSLPSIAYEAIKWRDPTMWDKCPRLPLAWFGDAFIGLHGLNWQYVPSLGRWYRWTGQLWEHVTDNALFIELRLFVQDTIGKYNNVSAGTRKKLSEAVVRAYESSGISSIEKSCRIIEDISINIEELDKYDNLLTCGNCTIDLRTCECVDFQREHYITKSINGNYNESAKCPLWDRFIHRALGGNPELIRYVQKCVGYNLLGGNPERRMWLIYDSKTKTGKTTFLNIIAALLGDYWTSVGIETFASNRKDLEVKRERAMLHGKRLVTISESDDGYQLSVNSIKQVTGNDSLNARNLNEPEFTFKPQFKVWIATNNRPLLKDADEAYWDRVRVIPFPVKIPIEERIPDLDKKIIESELDGVLMWALEGLKQYNRDNGFGEEPELVKLATLEWHVDTDHVLRFFGDRYELYPSGEVAHKVIYPVFEAWWKDEFGDEEKCLSKKSFTASLLRIDGITKPKKKDGIYFKGLRLKPPTSEGEAVVN